MRILYSHRILSRDGQRVHVDELVAALRQEGHEVLVAGPSGGGAQGGRLLARIRQGLPLLGELGELAYNLPAYRRLSRACRDFRPELIYERANLFHLAGLWLAVRTGLPFFLEVNSPLAEERARHGGLVLHGLARRLEHLLWRRAGRVLTVSFVLRDIVVRAGASPARVTVVANGAAPERFAPPPDAAGVPLTLGFVGFVRDWHGLDAVLRAMAAAPMPLSLVIVGDGPARPGLEALAGALGIAGRLRITGAVPPDRMAAETARFGIALQPRVSHYASPLKLFDYMAAGRAIVAPDQPNIREILTHGETALLFDPARDGALWQAVVRLMRDPALRARLGGAARAALERRDLTWRGNARRITALAAAR